MILYPVAAMFFSIVFTYFNLFARVNKKFLVIMFHVALLVNYLLIYWRPTKMLFIVFSGLLGYSSIVRHQKTTFLCSEARKMIPIYSFELDTIFAD